ncbi:MAG TPA: tetratricopeptide repeat protein [Thermoanaerobaculia bacterium]|nr:tetratricopeptide repeat protein [Thermoanaerobaculia bacterium]
MCQAHPAREELESFMLGDLPPQDTLKVLLHLLPGCARCQEITSAIWCIGMEAEPPAETPDSDRFVYDSSIERVFTMARRTRAVLDGERSEAAELAAELAGHDAQWRPWLVRNDSRFQTWGVCELLLRRSQGGYTEEPREAAELAELAVVVAESLDPRRHPRFLLGDLRARAWACLGNVRRILSDFLGAEEAFRQAEQHLAQGTGDRVEKASLFDLLASLRNAQGRFAEALRLLDRAVVLFRRAGQNHLVGRALINKGYVQVCAGNSEAAVELLRQGLTLADTGREPRLVLAARHALAYLLHELGRNDLAADLLARSGSLYDQVGGRMDLVRRRYLEGQIAAATGRPGEAEAALQEARAAFAEQGIGYDAALAALDLAAVYVGQGRWSEVRALAAEMIPLFEARHQHRDALAALILFNKAAESESLTAGLVREIAGQLRKARRD